MSYSLDINEKEMKPGRIYLGTVKVEMGRMFIFGQQERLHQMLSFVPGLGNGAYEVYGEIKNVPGHGFRVVKVEIEFITDDEILYLEKENADCVMEVAF
ncbi:hypothetical protein [Cytobacillus oceanisediminis]|uniref:hypothetical protein n=1 Tax=Cytobacillus oceanisediminis TaxID=665099 RepID=UPI001FB3FFAA|nr:hypothetical protein [Cytobacillus oceanisediminis]UOE58197.1 hypothetical protein IRB79_27225 [Cytobacillus oceanisediminis]